MAEYDMDHIDVPELDSSDYDEIPNGGWQSDDTVPKASKEQSYSYDYEPDDLEIIAPMLSEMDGTSVDAHVDMSELTKSKKASAHTLDSVEVDENGNSVVKAAPKPEKKEAPKAESAPKPAPVPLAKPAAPVRPAAPVPPQPVRQVQSIQSAQPVQNAQPAPRASYTPVNSSPMNTSGTGLVNENLSGTYMNDNRRRANNAMDAMYEQRRQDYKGGATKAKVLGIIMIVLASISALATVLVAGFALFVGSSIGGAAGGAVNAVGGVTLIFELAYFGLYLYLSLSFMKGRAKSRRFLGYVCGFTVFRQLISFRLASPTPGSILTIIGYGIMCYFFLFDKQVIDFAND